MLRHYLSISALVAALACAGGALQATAAAEWKGRELTKEGTLHMMNPAAPVSTREVTKTQALWHAGGDEDDDVLFGVITAVVCDQAGNAYLLDQQLNEVHVFSPNGEHQRSVGREGEGPGEFRRAGDLFLMPDGKIAVVQRMPGKIVLLTPQGDPAGDIRVPGTDGAPTFVESADCRGDAIILSTREFARKEGGADITMSLLRMDASGKVTTTFQSEKTTRNFANMVFDEKTNANAIWAVGSDGRVYVNTDFDAYSIKVYNADGSVDRVIERQFTHRNRSAKEMEDNKPRVQFRRNDQAVRPEVTASKTDRDVMAMFAREDGSLWVLSSRGTFDAPAGTIVSFDVFSKDGKFTRQVDVQGEGRGGDDGIRFAGDRMFVIRGLRSAQRAMNGGDEASDKEMEEAEPLSVICYGMAAVVQGAR